MEARGAETTCRITIDREAMGRPEWRDVSRRHIEGLASRLIRRGDLLRLQAETDRDLIPATLAMVIGEAAFDEDQARHGSKTSADFIRKAEAMLDATRDHGEVLNLTVRARAEIVNTFGPTAWSI